jgi:hypothetical protein
MSEQHTWKARHQGGTENAHILRKVLMQKYEMFIMFNNISCTVYCNHKIAVTLSTVVTWFFQVYNVKDPV